MVYLYLLAVFIICCNKYLVQKQMVYSLYVQLIRSRIQLYVHIILNLSFLLFCMYILIYRQGCDFCNHLSLFLCVSNSDKLIPEWSHFAQFTISFVIKDPKKPKYSDTLHRFWKKEYD